MPLPRGILRRQPLLQPRKRNGDQEDTGRLQGAQDRGDDPRCQRVVFALHRRKGREHPLRPEGDQGLRHQRRRRNHREQGKERTLQGRLRLRGEDGRMPQQESRGVPCLLGSAGLVRLQALTVLPALPQREPLHRRTRQVRYPLQPGFFVCRSVPVRRFGGIQAGTAGSAGNDGRGG